MDKVYALPNLMSAFKEVKRRKGGAGVDHQTIEKPGSREKRPLGIPTVRDRVAQAALRHVLEPNFERDFAEQSYGFRPKRGCKDALRRVNSLLKAGYQSSKR
jgi:retron-type reverse transcriptase